MSPEIKSSSAAKTEIENDFVTPEHAISLNKDVYHENK